MGLLRQAWVLTKKNLLVVFIRHWVFTTIRAFLAPIVFVGLSSVPSWLRNGLECGT